MSEECRHKASNKGRSGFNKTPTRQKLSEETPSELNINLSFYTEGIRWLLVCVSVQIAARRPELSPVLVQFGALRESSLGLGLARPYFPLERHFSAVPVGHLDLDQPLRSSPTQRPLRSPPLQREPTNDAEAIVSSGKNQNLFDIQLHTITVWARCELLGCVWFIFLLLLARYKASVWLDSDRLCIVLIKDHGRSGRLGSEERREEDRECPRVRLRPWATSTDVSSGAATSVSNLTGNFFLCASKPQSQTLPPTSMSLSSSPPLLLSSIPLLWKTQRLQGKYLYTTTPRATQVLLCGHFHFCWWGNSWDPCSLPVRYKINKQMQQKMAIEPKSRKRGLQFICCTIQWRQNMFNSKQYKAKYCGHRLSEYVFRSVCFYFKHGSACVSWAAVNGRMAFRRPLMV